VVYRIGAYHFEANTGYSSSSDGGLTWENGVVNDSPYPEYDHNPRVVEYGKCIYVFFAHGYDQDSGLKDIWFRKWNGIAWEEPQQLTDTVKSGKNSDEPAPACISDQLWIAYRTDKTGTRDVWVAKLFQGISAILTVSPSTLNLESKGKWITAYIELPESFDVADIDISSILLNGTIPVALSSPSQVADYDGDGVPDLMVKFDRAAVQSYILRHAVIEDRCAAATLTLTGKLNDGTEFEGNDAIRCIFHG
jgi:hypothetical protein